VIIIRSNTNLCGDRKEKKIDNELVESASPTHSIPNTPFDVPKYMATLSRNPYKLKYRA